LSFLSTVLLLLLLLLLLYTFIHLPQKDSQIIS